MLKRARKTKMIKYQLELIIVSGVTCITYQASKD